MLEKFVSLMYGSNNVNLLIKEEIEPTETNCLIFVKVYHHCLFGTRYDFLCANYTAFDQTLFNCNFVSNVDCENSKNFWHRNDDLYKAGSTTTAAPTAYNFYTPAPQALPLTASPGQLPALPPAAPINPRRQGTVPRSRPPARVRPQYDYYEDEYEEIPRPKSRKRRPRPRPVYYDDYEEYDDDRTVRRGGGRRRGYFRRDRPLRRNKDRRIYDDDEVDYRYEDDDLTLGTKQKEKRRRLLDDYEYEEDRRSIIEKRRPQNRRDDKPLRKSNKRPVEDDYEEENERYERRKLREENRKTPRLGKRRPPSEEYEDDLQQADDPRSYDRPRKINKENTYKKTPEDGRPIIKPVSGTIYDRPRVAPKINLPVPKNAADKFAYKSIAAQTTPAVNLDDEEYEEYEEPLPKRLENNRKGSSSRVPQTNSKEEYSESPLRSNTRPKLEVIKERDISSTSSSRKRPTVTEYEDYEDDKIKKTEKLTSSTTSTTESPIEHYSMPVIRKFKRPFLPSRGGNPYAARGLQPVGVKALNKTEAEKTNLEEAQNEKTKISLDPVDLTKNSNEEIQEVKPDLKPIPIRVKSPLPQETIIIPPVVDASLESTTKENNNKELKAEIKPGPVRIKVPIRVKSFTELENTSSQNQNRQNFKTVELSTTAQSKLIDPDILNENYDVTLNEAISPIIPNIPVRSFSGFNAANDYTYKRFQRPTKYVILDPVVSAGSTYYVK